jgi:hypothetical protein
MEHELTNEDQYSKLKLIFVNIVHKVAIALKSPLAIRSISSSICCSVEEGELRIVYVFCGIVASIGGVAALVDAAGGGGRGRRENNEGEGAMNDKYWSTTP